MYKYITYTNKGASELCLNMLKSLRRFSNKTVDVYCDDASKSYISDKVSLINFLPSNIQISEYFEYQTANFNRIAVDKVESILHAMENSTDDIFYLDVDMFFLDNPDEITEQYANTVFDVYFQSDAPLGANNCGCMLIKNNQKMKDVWKRSQEIIISSKYKYCEQDAINEFILVEYQRKGEPLNTKQFDKCFISNGWCYFREDGPKLRCGQKLVHANFYCGIKEKTNIFKNNKMWLL